MMYFLLNEAKEPQNPKNHKIVFLDVFSLTPYTPRKLTWNIIIMEVWKIIFLSKLGDGCSFHVNLPGCISQMIIYLTFFRGNVGPEESYYLPKELVQQLSSWKDATSLVNGSL